MLPSLLIKNSGNGALVYSKIIRNLFLSPSVRSLLSDAVYGFICKFVCAMKFSAQFCKSKLRFSIVHVILMGAYKKMIWIAAFSIIAFVANHHLFRNFSVMENPRKSVRGVLFSSKFSFSIPAWVTASSPFDAVSSFFSFAKKPRNWIFPSFFESFFSYFFSVPLSELMSFRSSSLVYRFCANAMHITPSHIVVIKQDFYLS